jgi:hypothetical protein
MRFLSPTPKKESLIVEVLVPMQQCSQLGLLRSYWIMRALTSWID